MRPVIIGGPTAGGKSALALALAERDGGIVVNADALQVYACWRILTARPDAADTARAPHALYGHVACSDRYSVGRWLGDVADVLAAARAARRRPIIVGGTGLYLTALTEGIAPVPQIAAAIRAEAEAMDAAQLRAALALRDPETLAGIDSANPARLRRAWEVLAATGRGLRAWQREKAEPRLPARAAVTIIVAPETSRLDRRIAERFRTMLGAGALEEVRVSLEAGPDARAPAARALGAAALTRHLRGEITLGEAEASAILDTRRLAKRQRTWFRNRMPDWRRIDPDAGALPDLVATIPRD